MTIGALAMLAGGVLQGATPFAVVGERRTGAGADATSPQSQQPQQSTSATATSSIPIPDSAYPIPADALFVAADGGSDANLGTEAEPFATVAHAVGAAAPGATIVMREGVYRESLGTISKPVTVQAYPHDQVWLSGSVVVNDWMPVGDVWVHPNWTVQFCQTCFDARVIDPNFPNAGLPDMVFVDGRPLAQVTSIDALGPGRFFADYVNQNLYVGDDPTQPGTLVEASALTNGAQFAARAAGSIVRGIGFEQYAPNWNFAPTPAMVLVNDAANVTFDRDVFARSATRGLTIYAPSAVVTNSWFVDNGYTALHGNHADDIDVEGNVIVGSNAERFSAGYSPVASASGMKFTHTFTAMIRNNVVQDGYANGIWFDISSYNVTIVDNLTRRNERNGIYVEITGSSIVASNVSTGNGQAGIKLSGATDARVYNNTVADNATYQLSVFDDGRDNTDPTKIALGITWNTANNELVNNILAAPDTGSVGPLVFTEDLDEPKSVDAATMITVMDANVYARATPLTPDMLALWTRVAPELASGYADLPALQAALGDDGTSIEYTDYSVSPVFTDPANGDYSLLATSPAVGSGNALPDDIAAAIGVAPTTTPNRGALIYPPPLEIP